MIAKSPLIFCFILTFFILPSVQARESASTTSSVGTDSLSLEECYYLALVQSETVAIQKEAISRATAQIFNAASQGLGNVDFIIERTFQDDQKSNLSALGDPNIHESKFKISQPLFQGFKAIGPGAETRIPMGVAIIGGVLVSTLLTLFVVPAFYLVCDKVEQKGSLTLIFAAIRDKLASHLPKKSS